MSTFHDVAMASAGGLVALVAKELKEGIAAGCKAVWRWLRKPYKYEEVKHLPYLVQRLRWRMVSVPDQRLTFKQWIHRLGLCRIRGHRFPRGLPNSAGRWSLPPDGFGGHWFGVCARCEGLIMRGSEELLDEAEQKGTLVPRTRRPKRLAA